jgi:membrane protease YdiL (CAAX protease family)
MNPGHPLPEPPRVEPPPRRYDVLLFFTLACGITWCLDLPFALATLRNLPPPSWALPLTGLGALGPTLAAFAIAARRRELRDVFGRWRTSPLWILIALALPIGLQLVATLIEVALGGHPARWFYPPVEPERMAALVMFPLGEEFGWRGFAYPRLARRYGPVIGCAILGPVWALWHLGMMVTPGRAPDLVSLGAWMLTMTAGSLVWAWVFERGRRSMAVAIALHVAVHLDNVNRAPESEVRLRVLRFVVLVVAAALAARALSARASGAPAPATG